MSAPLPRMGSKRSVLLLASYACVFSLLSSCRKSGHMPVYPVHGQVFTDNNKAPVGALVVFHPVDTSDPEFPKPLGRVDQTGAFTLTTYEEGDGAPEGEYVVTIRWRARSASPFAANREGEDRLHGRYSDPKESNLRFKIEKRAKNVLPAIRLR